MRAQTVPTGILKAVVTLNGQSYEYLETNGQDLGDFVSSIGNFTQRCIRVTVAGSPLTVFFRPDKNSDRVEVVVELGKLFSGTPANLGAYSVAISRGTSVLATVNVPAHYWFSRWRWQSSPRPIVGNVPALIAQGLLPPYDRSAAPPPPPPVAPTSLFQLPSGQWLNLLVLAEISVGNYANVATLVVPPNSSLLQTTSLTPPAGSTTSNQPTYAIMGLAGVTAYMPQTGERNDIGPVTEPQAEYICTASQSALELLRAQAEAAGTVPWHYRDEQTGAPLNFVTYPRAQWYSANPSVGTPYVACTTTPITMDGDHQPALAYVPYLLTGDPYHLETLQFQVTWTLGSLPPNYRPSIPQGRWFAWTMRSLGQAAKITPGTVPSWLLPQGYWSSLLETWRIYFETNYVNNTSPERARFRATGNINDARDEGPTAPGGTWVDPWQDEFVAMILGWLVNMGFSSWRTSFDWKIGSTMARATTNTGWIRAHATPYRIIVRASRTSPFANTWAEAWTLTKNAAALTYTDPNTWASPDMTYLMYTRGALFYADKLGVSGAAEGVTWATSQLKLKNWKTAYKWRLGAGL